MSKTCTVNNGKFYILVWRVLENTKIQVNLHFSYLAVDRLRHVHKDQSQKVVSGRITLHTSKIVRKIHSL